MIIIIGTVITALSGYNFKEGFGSMEKHESMGPYTVPDSPGWFMANNTSSPNCCKAATYSTGDGCVCMTKDQLQFINQRGGNRTIEDGF